MGEITRNMKGCRNKELHPFYFTTPTLWGGERYLILIALMSSYTSPTMLRHKWYGKINANKATRTSNGAKVVSMSFAHKSTMAVAA